MLSSASGDSRPYPGVSSRHWTTFSYGDRHPLPLKAGWENGKETSFRRPEREGEQARKHLSISSSNMGVQLKEWGIGYSLLTEKLTYFYAILYSTKYLVGAGGRRGKTKITVLVILWNMKVFSLNVPDSSWHLLTLNCKRSLRTVYFHPSCENN